jgi:hypothetical protein
VARTIIEDEQLKSYSLKSWVRVIVFGLIVGAAHVLLSLAIAAAVVEPLACRQISEATSCVNASVTAGRIATVLVAALAVFGLVRLGAVRPVIIAIASAAVLWSLSTYLQGLDWYEALAWSVALYATTYALFGWIARTPSSVLAIIISIVVTLLIRILLI